MTFKSVSTDTAEEKASRLKDMDKYEIKKSILKAAANSNVNSIRPKELAIQLVEACEYINSLYDQIEELPKEP